jgi:hypothetical protein
MTKQPDIAITYEPGDFVLKNPRRDTGAVGLRKNKLEPTNLGPYEVIQPPQSADGTSNTVEVCEVNDRGKKHEFHAPTLRIFTGTAAEAKDLAKLDNLEFDITRVMGINGNTANRDELEVTIEFEDGTVDSMEYSRAIHTSAFAEYCRKKDSRKHIIHDKSRAGAIRTGKFSQCQRIDNSKNDTVARRRALQ